MVMLEFDIGNVRRFRNPNCNFSLEHHYKEEKDR